MSRPVSLLPFTPEQGFAKDVYGLLRTEDSLSSVSRAQVLGSTWLILGFYLVIFTVGLWVLLRLLREPPYHGEPGPQPTLPDEVGHS